MADADTNTEIQIMDQSFQMFDKNKLLNSKEQKKVLYLTKSLSCFPDLFVTFWGMAMKRVLGISIIKHTLFDKLCEFWCTVSIEV